MTTTHCNLTRGLRLLADIQGRLLFKAMFLTRAGQQIGVLHFQFMARSVHNLGQLQAHH